VPPALRVRFWGVRGSVPAPGPRTARYGGNTPCVEVCAFDPAPGAPPDRVILDAGTGIRALGDQILDEARRLDARRPLEIVICVTHAHWDHVQGLPFFAPIYDPATRLTVVVGESQRAPIEQVVRTQMQPPAFPVRWDSIGAAVSFESLPLDGAPRAVGALEIRAVGVHHPGEAAGFAVSPRGGGPAETIVYLPDNELARIDGASSHRAALVDALRGAALLVHDATYVPEELPARANWGHSAWDEAVRLAADAGVGRLALFHHHAERADAALDKIVTRARALAREVGGDDAPLVLGASEGLVLHV
jgi:phosphoribosyl 1,2-cyclic phosphodiesterase